MNEEWFELETVNDIEDILNRSSQKLQIIFKHSTRCPVSSNAFREVSSVTGGIVSLTDINYVDVIRSRGISQEIASKLQVRHESPQLLLINNQQLVWNVTHYQIEGEAIVEKIKALSENSTVGESSSDV